MDSLYPITIPKLFIAAVFADALVSMINRYTSYKLRERLFTEIVMIIAGFLVIILLGLTTGIVIDEFVAWPHASIGHFLLNFVIAVLRWITHCMIPIKYV